jgi:hypothetical protein
VVSFVRLFALLLTLGVALAGGASAHEERKTHAGMVLAAVDNFVVPRVERVEKAATALANGVAALCADPADARNRATVVESFGEVVRAWGAIEFFRAGPVTQASRLERFHFWPDPRGTASRQLTEMLANRDSAKLLPAAFATQSAAVQGLAALEILLFNDRQTIIVKDDDAKFRCGFAQAIATNLVAIGHDLSDGWTAPDGFRLRMLTPGSDNPVYKDASDTGRDIVKAIVTGLELTISFHAAPEIEAAAATPPKSPRLPFERSRLTSAYLEAELTSIEALFNATGLIAFVPADKGWMETFIPNTFKEIAKDAAALEQARSAKPADAAARSAAAKKLKFDLGALRLIIVRELAPAAELTLGFNELDGD